MKLEKLITVAIHLLLVSCLVWTSCGKTKTSTDPNAQNQQFSTSSTSSGYGTSGLSSGYTSSSTSGYSSGYSSGSTSGYSSGSTSGYSSGSTSSSGYSSGGTTTCQGQSQMIAMENACGPTLTQYESYVPQQCIQALQAAASAAQTCSNLISAIQQMGSACGQTFQQFQQYLPQSCIQALQAL